jgi:hypothetical protein
MFDKIRELEIRNLFILQFKREENPSIYLLFTNKIFCLIYFLFTNKIICYKK